MSDEVSVATDAAAATVEFLSSAISVLPSGATDPRMACGMMISVADCMKLRPMARAASACPLGTVLMPERNDSATNAAVYRLRPVTASQKKFVWKLSEKLSLSCANAPSTMNTMMIVSGMFLNSST